MKSNGGSVTSLFVTNLRLLNLDLLQDWPNITVSSFQDARAKIKCTEWALYQLFRLYDPATTAEKLQPFFPPLEPLQSVNLRAALYRCLNELKKNGVLPKETVLRKTMLDECSGDKFWEVCLGFSALVMRKVTLERRNGYGRPVAERLAMGQSVSRSQKESMLPLAIAHWTALSNVLSEKQKKKDTYTRLYDVLAQKEEELRMRKARGQVRASKTKNARPEQLKAVEVTVEKSWVGSTRLKEALVDGDTCASGDGILVTGFDALWKGDMKQRDGADVGLLQTLNVKATEQIARLKRWQAFHEKLVASKPPSIRSSRPSTSASNKSTIHFDRHRNLNLSDSPPPPEDRKPQIHKNTAANRYDEILTAMREQLRKTSASRGTVRFAPPSLEPHIQTLKRSQTTPIPHHNNLDASPGARNTHARSPSQTAVPVIRPGMARRVSSRSRSYQQPKVVSQREPIPLKSELFSPLKENRRESLSPMLPSPAEEEERSSDRSMSGVSDGDGAKVATTSGEKTTGARDSKLDISTNELAESSASSSGRSSASIPYVTTASSSTPPADAAEFKIPDLPSNKKPLTAGPATASRPSLAERTRMSMAPTPTEELISFLPEPPTTAPASTPSSPQTSKPTQQRDHHASTSTTLLERTRQSISLAPPQSRKSHARSSTAVAFPVNQFETPKKSVAGGRRSTLGEHDAAGNANVVGNGRREITPMEQLMSPEAEYSSVFKSRPKIAVSPVLSPRG